MLPYVAVLVFALIGINVMAVIFGGLVLTGIIGLAGGSLTLDSYFKAITDGIAGMSDLIILSMLIGGMVGVMKQNGGIDFYWSSSRNESVRKRRRSRHCRTGQRDESGCGQ